ncbi:hypothetical protein CERZMDRAFT_86446 [Cercospora zeae-maydis SCOH1-5]|uniref:Uncharacterized protein n=1 Tax=Cercospora zeae-maydis SCOH1-5 TaxID=717836 RepID=A0A6A6F9R8_9PEZI|nr:hypothetical protein CERZMDRAFT_86446 [Cercospora zeae-maydis SCOH1-5]
MDADTYCAQCGQFKDMLPFYGCEVCHAVPQRPHIQHGPTLAASPPQIQQPDNLAFSGDDFSGASDLLDLAQPTLPELQQANEPAFQRAGFPVLSGLENSAMPPLANMQQFPSPASEGNSLGEPDGSAGAFALDAPGYPTGPEAAAASLGECQASRPHPPTAQARDWLREGVALQEMPAPAAPVVAPAVEPARGKRARAAPVPFDQKSPTARRRQAQKSAYQLRSQHMAKQITKLCKRNQGMFRDKAVIASSGKKVSEWAEQHGLSWSKEDTFFRLKDGSYAVDADCIREVRSQLGDNQQLWECPRDLRDPDLAHLPAAWVTTPPDIHLPATHTDRGARLRNGSTPDTALGPETQQSVFDCCAEGAYLTLGLTNALPGHPVLGDRPAEASHMTNPSPPGRIPTTVPERETDRTNILE